MRRASSTSRGALSRNSSLLSVPWEVHEGVLTAYELLLRHDLERREQCSVGQLLARAGEEATRALYAQDGDFKAATACSPKSVTTWVR